MVSDTTTEILKDQVDELVRSRNDSFGVSELMLVMVVFISGVAFGSVFL
ncbi:MAG: hypothetical protein V3U71_04010 [Cocleimonas sp.]